MEQQQEQERMERMQQFEAALQRHGLASVHAAHRRLGISRESLTRMADGRAPELPQVEAFARGIGEDVNAWRTLYGYPPVAAYDGRAYYLEELGKLRAEFDPLPVEPQGWHEIQADTPPEVVDRRIMRLREDLLLRRGKKITQA